MNIYITGGTGFIGVPLSQYLLNCGHQVWVLTRALDKAHSHLPKEVGIITTNYDESSLQKLPQKGVDAVINLAGERVDQRWNIETKKKLINSRLQPTEFLNNWFKTLITPPKVLISGSAIGFYGSFSFQDYPHYPFCDESSGFIPGFTHELCDKWEQAAQFSTSLGVRVVLLRTGIVLSQQGGALAKMLLPFKMGVGGKIGSGKQGMSWVHLLDVIRLIEFCLEEKNIQGPVNAVAPEPVNNQTFTHQLGKALKRPVFFTVPATFIKLFYGEMGEQLLLKGSYVVPKKLTEAGFKFKFNTLAKAFNDILT